MPYRETHKWELNTPNFPFNLLSCQIGIIGENQVAGKSIAEMSCTILINNGVQRLSTNSRVFCES